MLYLWDARRNDWPRLMALIIPLNIVRACNATYDDDDDIYIYILLLLLMRVHCILCIMILNISKYIDTTTRSAAS